MDTLLSLGSSRNEEGRAHLGSGKDLLDRLGNLGADTVSGDQGDTVVALYPSIPGRITFYDWIIPLEPLTPRTRKAASRARAA